jgi:hypothetical protein
MAWQLFDGRETLGPSTEDAVIALIVKGLRSGVMVRREGASEWSPLSVHAPFALDRAESTIVTAIRRRRKPLAAVGGAVLLLGAVLMNTLWLGWGSSVDVNCSTNGSGTASCVFNHRGFLPGPKCVMVRMVRYADQGILDSERICSGVLMPKATTSVVTAAAWSRSPAAYCRASWREECEIVVVPQ